MAPATRRSTLVGAAVAVGACLATTGPLYRVRTWWSFDDPLAADTVVIGVHVALGAAGAAAFARAGRWRHVDRTMSALASALTVWLAFSALWSADPATTAREGLLVGATLLAGAGAAAAAGERLFVAASWIGVHLGLAWSAILIGLVMANSQDANGGWTGVYFNPNSLALVATVGILLSLLTAVMLASRRLLPSVAPGVRAGAIAIVGCSVLADLWLISGTGALTPLFAAAGAVGAGLAAIVGRRLVAPAGRFQASTIVGTTGLALLVAGAAAWLSRDSWLPTFGRTGDLTGRTVMWEVSLDWFAQSPVIGQGYFGAWDEPEFLAEMLAERGEILGSTHNTFIEVLLGAGVVGFALMAGLYGCLWLAAGGRALTGTDASSTWPLVGTVFVLGMYLGESLLVAGHLLVAVTGALIVASSTATKPTAPAPDPSAVAEPIGSESGR